MTPWERFADLVLQREAALCRVVSGVPPRDFAGMYVDDDDLDTILRSLPGLDGPGPEAAAPVRDLFAPLVDQARAALALWCAQSADALARACRNAGLAPPDVETIALLTAVELDPQRQRVVAYVQDSVQLPRPCLALLARALGPAGPPTVAPGSPLRVAELVTVEDSGPWAVRMCGVAPRLVWAVLGVGAPDPDLPPRTRRVPAQSSARGRRPPPPALLLVHGADAESRRRAVGAELAGRPLLATSVPESAAEWAAVVREATVDGCAVLLEVTGPPEPTAAARIETAPHLTFALSSPRELPLEALPERRWREVHVLDGEAGPEDWLARTGSTESGGARLTREQLRLVAGGDGGDPAAVQANLRRLAGGHLDGLAVRVRARRGWDDLVLPDAQKSQLRELVARYRRRRTVFGEWGFPAIPSTGVVALFAGPSGTGKTLAAEVVARELALDLYKVDLSSVVSKYIGETEKNLERIFAAAGAGDVVLFFDEADALFGKRSEVSSAHDRYANIEVAYLLQRLETFDGLVVLATNLQRNIDDAFLRRIGVAVNVLAPDEEQRRRIWQLVFPAGAPVEDLDLDFLARQFKVTGGVIRNAALGAAFSAADDGGPITMERLVLAMQREFVKLGHLSTETEFARYFDVVRSGR
ncbi:AAA family ATPase [Cellulomonas xylanilytica]|uniref:AAA family ATPase n=1 Tax=Cellulomonas xylanilytica TaxID=233583 RepID=UPI001C9A08BB|nr:AAA family ATPase [Cellulomonas xylanilytica]